MITQCFFLLILLYKIQIKKTVIKAQIRKAIRAVNGIRVTSVPVRFQYLFLFVVILASTIIFFLFNNTSDILLLEKTRHNNSEFYYNYNSLGSEDRFTINTEGCTITALQPFDESVRKFVEYPKKPKMCPNANLSLLKSNITYIWIDEENIAYYNISNSSLISCCYKSFYRPMSIVDITSTRVDDRVEYKDCRMFLDIINIEDEFVRVTCNSGDKQVYDQYYLTAPKKKIKLRENSLKFPKNKTGYNIIILGIDAVSRLNFHRTLPRTLEYLRKKEAIELLGYNKVGDNTFPNLIPMLLGIRDTELQTTCLPSSKSTFDNCPFIWELYKDAGYYTAFGEDSSFLGTFNYGKSGFAGSPTDYYIHTFINEAEDNIGTNKDFNSKLCMNDKYFFNVLVDYVKDLTFTLSSNKLFGLFWEVTMSHDNLNYPMVMDDSLKEMLTQLDDSNYLNETILFLVSDHGIRWGDIRSTKQGRLEERLPFVFVLFPDSFSEHYNDAFNNLKLNRKRLTTPFDIHATLLDLVNLDKIKDEAISSRSKESYSGHRSISLFLPIPTNRTCHMADIDNHWCTCHSGSKIAKDSNEAHEATNFLINYLNILLNNYPQCARLSLEEIIDASEMLVPYKDEKDWREFMVVVKTSPGGGVFEATLRNKSQEWTLAGTVSRLNLYGEQSRCVHHYQLKLYCFCQ